MPRDLNDGELLITGGSLIDGTGAARRSVDIMVRGDRIVAIGPHGTIAHDGAHIDASGLTIAPGFIDVHTHDDNAV